MGRSRTMNETRFSIYKSGIPQNMLKTEGGVSDIKKLELTRQLYIHNCDRKMAGNISSIYLTLVALFNLSQESFYYSDEIVNAFLEKMVGTIGPSIEKHEKQLVRNILGNPVPAQMYLHILMDKFRKSSSKAVSDEPLTSKKAKDLLRQIVQQKFEQRLPSGDFFDDYIMFLSGEQRSLMEISYTKQQQKQRQKQQNKNQNSDAMGVFHKRNQLYLTFRTDNYFEYTKNSKEDFTKHYLSLPSSIPITTVTYQLDGNQHTIRVYPTVQFLYSHFIQGEYITQDVHNVFKAFDGDTANFYERFLKEVSESQQSVGGSMAREGKSCQLVINVDQNYIVQNPQYTIAGLGKGKYIIGMKEQFNVHDIAFHPLVEQIQYVTDEMGFVLLDKTKGRSVDEFGPYFIEQYILMEVLAKQEIAQNVIDYYCNHKNTLQTSLEAYDERQGKGFICWRFLLNETTNASTAKGETPVRD